MGNPKYKRVLLKISGEALAGDASRGLDFHVIGQVCDVVKRCVDMGVQVGVVVGGGNFWRGVKDGGDQMERVRADHMGMLATAINALAVAMCWSRRGCPSGSRPPSRCGLSPSPTSGPGPSATWKREEWSFSAAAPETHFSPPTPRRSSGPPRSTRTSSCWPRTSTAFTPPIPSWTRRRQI